MKGKTIIRKISVFLAIAMMLTIPSAADELETKPISPGEEIRELTEEEIAGIRAEMDYIRTTEAPAHQQYVNLLSAMIIDEKLSQTYAGAYLDDNKHLVILSTSADEDTKIAFKKASSTQEVQVLQASFSYTDLKTSMDLLHSRILTLTKEATKEERRVLSQIVGMYIDEPNNCVTIKMETLDEDVLVQVIQLLEVDQNKIRFEKGSKLRRLSTNIKPGSGILWFPTACLNVYGSVGYPAKLTTAGGQVISGFTSAGHVFCVGGNPASIGTNVYDLLGTIIGTVYSCYAPAVGNADISFVKKTSSTNLSYYTRGAGEFLSSSLFASQVATGETIWLCGMYTYDKAGTVDANYGITYSIDYDIDNDGVDESIYDVIICHFASGTPYAGDSGGVVYYPSSSPSNQIVGTLIGASVGNESEFYVSKVGNNCSALNISLY